MVVSVVPADKPRFHALLIGIDVYKCAQSDGLCNLTGSVADADDMCDFLVKTMGIPPSDITNLRNEQATRANIKSSLQALAKNERIRNGDSIVIYFAGHGSTAKAPSGWSTDGTSIQMLLPYDFDYTSTDNNAQGFFDLTFAALLSEVVKAKGDNITVILDSCHSGSSTRSDDSDTRVRGFNLPSGYIPRPSVDEDVLVEGHRGMVTAPGSEKTGLASHVLLAACSANGPARETGGRGVFTQALLSLLRGPDIQLHNVTYLDIMDRLPDLPEQHPQCEGVNASRVIFTNRASNRGHMLYKVTAAEDGQIILDAGKVQGIMKGAHLDIYATQDFNAPVLGQLVAQDPSTLSTILINLSGDKMQIPVPAWALLNRKSIPTVNIHVPDSNDSGRGLLSVCESIVDQMKTQHASQSGIRLVDKDHPHELTVAKSRNKQVQFGITDHTCRAWGLERLPHSVPSDASILSSVFGATADFFYHLRRTNARSPLTRCLTIQCHALEERYAQGSDIFPILSPTGDNLIVGGVLQPRVFISGAEDDHDDHAYYGFKIASTWNKPLYVWIFAFEMNDLSIGQIYSPTYAKQGGASAADPSIPPHGELTIGYGSGGVAAQGFSLTDDQSIGVTYLKIFVTSQYVDLSYIQQASPFEEGRPICISKEPKESKDVWATMLLAIVQKRQG